MKKISCSLLVFATLWHASAQLPEFTFRHYTVENGFSTGSIDRIGQDKYGFLWFLSSYELARYDGHAVRTYRHNDKDSFSLPAGRLLEIVTGNNGMLLIKYDKGIAYYDYSIDGFRKLLPDTIKLLSGRTTFTKDDKIWFATTNKLLHQFDIKSGKTKTFAACNSYITALFVDSKNNMWIGTHTGLYRFYPQQNRYELYWKDTIHTGYGAGLVHGIMEDEKNTIWFTGYNSGIYSLNADSRQVRFFDFKPVHTGKSEIFNLTSLSTRIINGQQYILTTSDQGVACLNTVTGKYSIIRHNPGNQYSLPSGGIVTVFKDRTGTLWVATNSGLCKTERMQTAFNTVHLPLLQNIKSVQNDDVWNYEIKIIYQDDQEKNVWIGTATKGLLQYDLRTDQLLKQIDIHDNQLRPRKILKLFMDKGGRLWIGTVEGVCIYEPATGHTWFLHEKNTSDLFSKSEVSSNFIQDAIGNIWIGTVNGVSIYDSSLRFLKNLKEEKNRPGTLQGQHVFALYAKNDRQVWVSTSTLNLYDTDKSSFVTEIYKNRVEKTLPPFILNITKDDKGNFYFTNQTYVYILDKKTDSFYIPGFNRLLDRALIKTFVDRKGLLWIASKSTGLFRASPIIDSVTRFTNRNGLASNELTYIWQSRQYGPIFLATTDGFQYFYTDSIKPDTTRAPLRITGIDISGKPLKADYQLFSDSALKVSYKQNVITFSFSLLDYSFTENITYQYKLEGFDKEWINAGGRQTATYTNLDASNYVFRVKANNHNGADAGQAIIKLRIVPPFWNTWWFISLVALAIFAALYWWYAYQQQKYRSEKILNSFTTSLYGQSTLEDMAWDIAANCITKLGFVDCVVYILDKEKNVLVQKAACGPKNPMHREILNPIEISPGKGIVGSVAQSGVAEIIKNTSRDKRYIIDDIPRLSEISVPIVADGVVYGIIDSEHPTKNFYTRRHLYLLKEIAATCAVRISKYLTEERLRSKIARDLHDEMGSTLTSINIISKMALQQADGDKMMSNNLQKIKYHSGNMMEIMSDIVWAINPANDTLDKIIVRMKEFAAEISEPARINYYFREEGMLHDIKLNLEQRKDLFLIFKEALNNAVKYSEASEIHILLRRENGWLKMEIADNGKGFELKNNYSGNGLKNMHSRAAQMQAELKIQSMLGTGSTILLTVAIP